MKRITNKTKKHQKGGNNSLRSSLKDQYIKLEQQKCSSKKQSDCKGSCELKNGQCLYKMHEKTKYIPPSKSSLSNDQISQAKEFLNKTAYLTSKDLAIECTDKSCKDQVLEECVILLDTIDTRKETSKQVLDMFAKRPFSEVFNLCTRAAKSVIGAKL
jgi:hypothetical protein